MSTCVFLVFPGNELLDLDPNRYLCRTIHFSLPPETNAFDGQESYCNYNCLMGRRCKRCPAVVNPLFGDNVEFCVETWSFNYAKVYKTVILALFYIMPLVFMAVVYYKIGKKVWASADKTRSMKLSNKHASNSKLRLTKIALAIILSFAVSWTPWNTMSILFHFDPKNYPYSKQAAHVAYPMVYFVAFSNCALNPLLYCYMSQNFRKALQIFRKRRSRRDLGDSITASSRSSIRRFSRRSKRNGEQAVEEPNGVPPEKGTLRTNSENHDCSRTSQPEANHTRESILMMSAL